MSNKEQKKKGRMPANINIDVKPAPGDSYTVIDKSNKKILMKVSIGCQRDKNPKIDGEMQKQYAKLTKGEVLQLSRYDGVSEPYFFAKLGKKGHFVPVTFLVGPHHKKCLGFEGLPTDSNIKKALKDDKLLRYEWTGEKLKVALAVGKEVFDLNKEGVAMQIMPKGTKPAAKKPAAKKPAKKPAAKKTSIAKEAKESGAVKKPAAKRVTWYQAIDGKIKKKRSTKQPEGFYATEKDAKLNRIVSDPVAAEAE